MLSLSLSFVLFIASGLSQKCLFQKNRLFPFSSSVARLSKVSNFPKKVLCTKTSLRASYGYKQDKHQHQKFYFLPRIQILTSLKSPHALISSNWLVSKLKTAKKHNTLEHLISVHVRSYIQIKRSHSIHILSIQIDYSPSV